MPTKRILLPLHRPNGNVPIVLCWRTHQERQVRIPLVAKCDLKHQREMKIELTMTELLLIVDMIKNGIEPEDNEGTDFYTENEFNAKEK